MTTTKTVYRKSTDGKFTTKRYSENHPSTTEKERVYVPAPKADPKRK